MSWTVAAVGDVMFDHPVRPDNPAFAYLRDAHVAFANLEMALSRAGEPLRKPIVLRADPDLATGLPDMGVGVVSLANNHTMDYGAEGLRDTIAAVRGAGVGTVGAGQHLDAALAPHLVKVKDSGVNVAWLALACTLPAGFAASANSHGVAPLRVRARLFPDPAVEAEQPGTSPFVVTEPMEEDLSRACDAIRAALREAAIVFVSLHWGIPPGWLAGFQGLLAGYQQPVARALIDAGAHAVFGHHPHTLYGVEIYKNRPIFYSMGHLVFHLFTPGRNIVFNQPGPPYRIMDTLKVPEFSESAIFLLDFRGNTLEHIRVVPCALDKLGEGRPVSGRRAHRILTRLQDRSSEFGTSFRIDGSQALVSL